MQANNKNIKQVMHLCFASLILLAFTNNAFALFEDITFKKAHQAYKKNKQASLASYTQQLKAKHYHLAPYAEYWLIQKRKDQTSVASMLDLMNRTPDFAFNQALRAKLLRKLGKAGDWSAFYQHHAAYEGNDKGVACLVQQGNAVLKRGVDADAVRKLWLSAKRMPSVCNPLFDSMMQRGVITKRQQYQRVRLALFDGQTSLAKSLALKLPGVTPKIARLVDSARKKPERFLLKRRASFTRPFGAELNLFAVDRLARKNVDKAARALQQVQRRFSKENRAVAWQRLAYRAAKDLHPKALDYYANGKHAPKRSAYLLENAVYLEENDWHARAALRAENWSALLNIMATMPASQALKARWRYWRARAVKAVYQQSPEAIDEADQLLIQLGKERHYYGWLAAEEVGLQIEGYGPANMESDARLVQNIATLPLIRRAVALFKLGAHYEGRREWYAAIKPLSDEERLAASTYAQKIGWHDVSVNTADRTRQIHNFDLRYPVPYRQYFEQAAANESLDLSWVLGLVRQESRFIDYAKSRVGASGLMQLMPKTARWSAKKMGMRGYSSKKISDVKTNVALGTFYMHYTLSEMNGNAVMATAAYNAGPSRALKWQANRPLEGAIYMETIPFNETRNYVQRVMANAHLYAPRIGANIQTLKQRIGIIPAKNQ